MTLVPLTRIVGFSLNEEFCYYYCHIDRQNVSKNFNILYHINKTVKHHISHGFDVDLSNLNIIVDRLTNIIRVSFEQKITSNMT